MATRLFVGGISWDTTEDTLKDFFAQVGPVVSATIIKDKMSGRSKGFGFVEMETEDAAQAAIDQLHDQELDGRKLTVNEAKPREDRNDRGNDRSNDQY